MLKKTLNTRFIEIKIRERMKRTNAKKAYNDRETLNSKTIFGCTVNKPTCRIH